MRKKIITLSLLLFLSSFIIILFFGRKATIEYDIKDMENISVTCDNNIIKCII